MKNWKKCLINSHKEGKEEKGILPSNKKKKKKLIILTLKTMGESEDTIQSIRSRTKKIHINEGVYVGVCMFKTKLIF